MSATTEIGPKPIYRRHGRIMLRIDRDGVAIKGLRKHAYRLVPWSDLARLAMRLSPPVDGLTEAEWADCLATMTRRHGRRRVKNQAV